MRTKIVNLEKLYDPNRVISNPQPLTKDKKFSDDGLFSEKLFGKNDDSDILSYHCKCGKYHGKFLAGMVCEECKTPIERYESKIEQLAWIDLGKYWIINPLIYNFLAKLAGGDPKLNRIINYDKKLDKDGEIIETEEELDIYDNIGLVEFKDKFFEILDYLYSSSKYSEKDLIYRLIMQNKDIVFINHIPIFDTTLRPASVTYKDKPVFKFDEINNSYNFIIQLSNMINKENKDFTLVVLPNLFSIQLKANIAFEKIIENLAGKEGYIRANVLGNRVNFSSRSVITPLDSGYDIADIVLPYASFIELYSFQLINLISRLDKISMVDALRIIQNAQNKFDPRVYNLCMDLVNKTKGGLKCIGIRNPTIARGSVLCHRIAGVKSDITDVTLSVHNCILALVAGDYDGDVYNIFALFDNEYKKCFWDTFAPINMSISNNDGLFNPRVSLDRDQVIGMYQLNN